MIMCYSQPTQKLCSTNDASAEIRLSPACDQDLCDYVKNVNIKV